MAGEVQAALANLSTTIRGGFKDISSSRLASKRLDLVGSRQEADIRAEERRFNDPTTQLGRQQAQNQLDILNAPAHIRELGKGFDSANLIEQGVSETIPAQLAALDARVDQKTGNLVKNDGTPLTNQDLINNSATLAGIRMGTTSITKTIETKLASLPADDPNRATWQDLQDNPHKAYELKMEMISNLMLQAGDKMSPAAKDLLTLKYKQARDKWNFHASKVLSKDERILQDRKLAQIQANIAAITARTGREEAAATRDITRLGIQQEAAASTAELRTLQKQVELAKLKAKGGRMDGTARVAAMKLAAANAQPIIEAKFNKDPETGALTDKLTGDVVTPDVLRKVTQKEITNQFKEITGEAQAGRDAKALKDLANLYEQAFGTGTLERTGEGEAAAAKTETPAPKTKTSPPKTKVAKKGPGLLRSQKRPVRTAEISARKDEIRKANVEISKQKTYKRVPADVTGDKVVFIQDGRVYRIFRKGRKRVPVELGSKNLTPAIEKWIIDHFAEKKAGRKNKVLAGP